MSLQDLPAVNASLNALTTVLLFTGWNFIRRGNRIGHRNCMIAALVSSAIFLACYLTYHFKVKAITRFVDPPAWRPVYLTILFTHTMLAVVIVPMVAMAFSRAFKQRFELHKKIARWTLPLWLYVSITGVVIYLMLYQIFPQK